jgi:hypothetical protein
VQAMGRTAPEIIHQHVNWLVKERHVQCNVFYNFVNLCIRCKFY